MNGELYRETRFYGPNGEAQSVEHATQVITRIYNSDGIEVAAITQSATSWREEQETKKRRRS